MVEEMYLEETKEQDKREGDAEEEAAASGQQETSFGRQESVEDPNPSLDPDPRPEDDRKPTPEQLLHHDSDSLSSIINNSDRRIPLDQEKDRRQQQQQNEFGRAEASFGVVDLDFSSYSHENSAVTYAGNSDGTFGGGGGVSLTLGLQQHGEAGTGVGLTLISPAGSSQPSLFFPRQQDMVEECQPMQYSSLLDGEPPQNHLPYRNLMAAQLLHDLAG